MLLAVGIYVTSPWSKYAEELTEEEIRIINKNYYLDTKCITDCPIIIINNTETWEQECWDKCVDEMTQRWESAGLDFSELLIRGNEETFNATLEKYKSKIIYWADELTNCVETFSVLSERMSCVRQVLPLLKEKCNIEK